MTLPLFICPDVAVAESGSTLTVTGDEARHATAVRRVRAGEQIISPTAGAPSRPSR